jgi:methylmalonyl-CoA/ethylmalonyl-CoA epimerase
MLGRPFHHIGIACADIDAAARYVQRAFEVTSDTGTVFDPEQNASVRLFNAGQPDAIELVTGPMVASLIAQKTSYYHICYTTPDIAATLREAKRAGAILVSPPRPAVLFGGRRVAFVFTPLGLVEFLEDP